MDILSATQVCEEFAKAQGVMDGCLAYSHKLRDGKLEDRRIYRGFLKIDILNIGLAVSRCKPFFDTNGRPPSQEAFRKLEEFLSLLAGDTGPTVSPAIAVHPTAAVKVLNRIKDLMATLSVAARSRPH